MSAKADYKLFAEVPVKVVEAFEQPLVIRVISEDQQFLTVFTDLFDEPFEKDMAAR